MLVVVDRARHEVVEVCAPVPGNEGVEVYTVLQVCSNLIDDGIVKVEVSSIASLVVFWLLVHEGRVNWKYARRVHQLFVEFEPVADESLPKGRVGVPEDCIHDFKLNGLRLIEGVDFVEMTVKASGLHFSLYVREIRLDVAR